MANTPLNVHAILSSGCRKGLWCSAPSVRVVKLGSFRTAAVFVPGCLQRGCRAGWVRRCECHGQCMGAQCSGGCGSPATALPIVAACRLKAASLSCSHALAQVQCEGRPGIAIQWGSWGGSGMAVRNVGFIERMERMGLGLGKQHMQQSSGWLLAAWCQPHLLIALFAQLLAEVPTYFAALQSCLRQGWVSWLSCFMKPLAQALCKAGNVRCTWSMSSFGATLCGACPVLLRFLRSSRAKGGRVLCHGMANTNVRGHHEYINLSCFAGWPPLFPFHLRLVTPAHAAPRLSKLATSTPQAGRVFCLGASVTSQAIAAAKPYTKTGTLHLLRLKWAKHKTTRGG